MSAGGWRAVIGLEIHVRLKTKSKLFSTSSAQYGADANTQADEVDLAMPGVLPSPNREAVRMAVAFGLAVGADIAPLTQFARKHYFYPDLPKGYQISQLDAPVVSGGSVDIELENGERKTVHLTRAHLEEDAGKSIHGSDGMSYIDLNRAGTPLIEVVSEPEMRGAAEAGAYMRKIHAIVRALDICDGNMQEGSLRCDANVSVRRSDDDAFGVRNEIKNLNSFRFIEKAIDCEIRRQVGVLESGGEIIQQTRLYDPDKNETRVMRGKEEAHDYRYFPDPDLPPIEITAELINEVREGMPTMPDEIGRRLSEAHGLSAEDLAKIGDDATKLAYFEACARATRADAAVVLNWVSRHLAGALKDDGMDDASRARIQPEQLAALLDKIHDGTLSDKTARDVFKALWSDGGDIDEIIRSRGLEQLSDADALGDAVARCCEANPEQVAQYRAGKTKVLGFLVGQVMKDSGGKANPAMVSQLLKERLDSDA